MSECYGSATLLYGFCLNEDFVNEILESGNKKFEGLIEGIEIKGCVVETNGNEDGVYYYVSVHSITTRGINPTSIKNLDILASEAQNNNWNKSLTNFVKFFKIPNISEEDFGWHLIANYGR